MCGIAGIVARDASEDDLRRRIRRMSQAVAHRGPDADGEYVQGSIALGFRRLSIIDLSELGNEPMPNEDGTLWLVYNGEIYNYRELRADLAARGHRFRSHADSEVILHLYEEVGADCVTRLRGMFAFALWDAAVRRLVLARDRAGEKPLCYATTPRGLVFASEPIAVFRSGLLAPHPSPPGIRLYLTWGYLPPPASAFEGLAHLPPAHVLVYEDGRVQLQRYWSAWEPGAGNGEAVGQAPGDENASAGGLADVQEHAGRLSRLIDDAVSSRLVSDVPVGAFLSGGLDSSAVVALMARHTPDRVKTFSIGFESLPYDELRYARAVAAHVGTEHREFVVRPDIVRDLPALVRAYGEPMLDPSGLATLYLSRAAREHVKVVLTGDGGDEVFGGYARYLATRLSDACSRAPRALRKAALALAEAGAPLARPIRWTARVLDGSLEPEPIRRYAKWLYACDPDGPGRWLFPEIFQDGDPIADLRAVLHGAWAWPRSPMRLDLGHYLPGDILRKADTTTMACGLEARAPLLDHVLIEAMSRTSRREVVRSAWDTKPALRRVAAALLPPAIVGRRKHGFTLPLREWLRGPLRPLVDAVVLDGFRRRGYARPDRIETMVSDHLAGRREWHTAIWTMLMLELWHQVYVDVRHDA